MFQLTLEAANKDSQDTGEFNVQFSQIPKAQNLIHVEEDYEGQSSIEKHTKREGKALSLQKAL